MTNSKQHHHVILTPRADRIEEAKALLLDCAHLVEARKPENGPSSWCFGFDADLQAFFIEALFPNQEAVTFHQANIAAAVKNFGPLMAKPPATTIRFVDWGY